MVRYEGTGITGEVILGIHNLSATKLVNIYRAFCSPICAYNAFPMVWLTRTSAIAGGEDIPSSLIIKLDSTAPALPAQVIIRKNSRGTQVADFQGGHPLIQTLSNVANARMFAAVGGANWPDVNAGKRYDSGFNSQVQNLTLREGQGLSVLMKYTSQSTYPRDIHLIFRIGTNMYSVWARGVSTTANGDEDLLHIFNGAGSGVVIYIVEVNCYVPGNTLSGRFGFGRFSRALETGGGLEITPIKMDSNSPAIPAGITCYKHVIFDSVTGMEGRSIQPWITSSIIYDTQQRYASRDCFLMFMPFASAVGPGRSVGGLGGITEAKGYTQMFDATISGKPIVVGQNELVGFFAPVWYGDVTGLRCEFQIEFTITDAPSAGGVTAAPRPYYGLGYG